jgi:hypothetical protein
MSRNSQIAGVKKNSCLAAEELQRNEQKPIRAGMNFARPLHNMESKRQSRLFTFKNSRKKKNSSPK